MVERRRLKNGEYFAEFFTLYMQGEHGGINDTLSEVLDELANYNTEFNTNTYGFIDMDSYTRDEIMF